MALYDPNEFPQGVETTKDFTLADVLAWARTKPAQGAYNYCDPHNCAVAQFGKETARPYLVGVMLDKWPFLKDALVDEHGMALPSTFGALADRLEKALA